MPFCQMVFSFGGKVMKKCPKCNLEANGTDLFCMYCGEKLVEIPDEKKETGFQTMWTETQTENKKPATQNIDRQLLIWRIASVVLLIGCIVLGVSGMQNQKEYETMERQYALLEQQYDTLEGELNSLNNQHMILTNGYNAMLEQVEFMDEYVAIINADSTSSKFQMLLSENRQSTWKGKMPGIIQGAVNGLNNMANNMLKLSPEQFVNGAKKHNVTLSVYLYGLADGTYKSLAEERLAEESARQKQYSQQNMQIERERQEKLRKINYEKNQAMGNMVYGKTTNWASANSTKQECWNCTYYYRANSTCTRTNTSANSSGSCIYWK